MSSEGGADEPVIEINAQEFTEEEKERILQVVAKDEGVRLQEKCRVDNLKKELRSLRDKGVPDEDEQSYGRVCKRCRTPLGLIKNAGEYCSHCGAKVCSECRIPIEHTDSNGCDDDWECIVCSKLRDIRAESGAWFYSCSDQPTAKKKKIYGSMLLKRIFKISKKQDYIIYKDPVWNEIIQGEPVEEIDEDYLVFIPSEGSSGKVHLSFKSNPKQKLAIDDIKPDGTGLTEGVRFYTSEEILAMESEAESRSHTESNNEDATQVTAKVDIHYTPDIENDSSVGEGISLHHEVADEHSNETLHSLENVVDEKNEAASVHLVVEEDHGLDTTGGRDISHEEEEEEEELKGIVTDIHVVEEEEDIDDIFNKFKTTKDVEIELEEKVSIISDHSEDGDAKPFLTVSGEAQIALVYDKNDSVFEVHVHKARDLLLVDFNKDTPDPYVKVYLISAARTLRKQKTKVKKNSVSPEFDEILSFKIEYEELETCVCSIEVWHYEFSNKNVPLGNVEINMQEFINNRVSLESPTPEWYILHTKRVDFSELTSCGELIINLQYKSPGYTVGDSNPTEGQFIINLIQAKGLKTEEDNLYCKISLVLSETDIRRMKSKVASGSPDPYWDEDFVLENISWAELETSYLQISIRGNQNDSVFIAGARLGLGKSAHLKHDSFGEEVKAWQSMLDHSNEKRDFCIPLRNNLDSVKQEKVVHQKPSKEDTDMDYGKLKKKKGPLSGFSTSRAKMFLSADTLSLASSGSMLSIYSNAGGESKNLVVTGEILFSMKHDTNSNVFSIHIEKAKDIAAANVKQHTSDPYCKVYVFPDMTKSTKKKTTHRRKTTNPEWKETIKYSFSREDLLTKTLQVSIWNHDRFGRNDFLGEVQVSIKDYTFANDLDYDSPIWYTLQEMAPINIGSAEEKKGELKVGIRFDRDVLSVHVKEASGLYAIDPALLPNSFVKCYLLPDKSRKCKRKTAVKKKTVTPIWYETFEYKGVGLDDLYSRVLEVTVWDHNTSGHQFLGGLRLGLSHGDEYWHDCFDKEVNIWEEMMENVGILAEYTIPLRATMTSKKGQILQEGPTNPPIMEYEEPGEDKNVDMEQNVDHTLLLSDNNYKIEPTVVAISEGTVETTPEITINIHDHEEEQKDLDDTFKIRKDLESIEKARDEDAINIASDKGEDGDVGSLGGEIQIDLIYDHNDTVLEVRVHKAKDLMPAELNKVKAKVNLTSGSKSVGKNKTKSKKKSRSPEFDEVLTFKVEYQVLVTCVCSVSVWHNDFSGIDVQIGEAKINIEEFLNNGFSLENPTPQWYMLHTKDINLNQLTSSGELIINLQYKSPDDVVGYIDSNKGQFHIRIIQAKGLNVEQKTMNCKMSLVLSKKDTRKMKSKHVTGSADPYWDEDFIFDNISLTELETSYLEISINGNKKNSVFIAGTRLGLGNLTHRKHDSFGEEVRAWQNMLARTDEAQEFCIPLRNNMESVKQGSVKEGSVKEGSVKEGSVKIVKEDSVKEDSVKENSVKIVMEVSVEEDSVKEDSINEGSFKQNNILPPKEEEEMTGNGYDIMKKKKDSLSIFSQSSKAKSLLNADTFSLASSGSMLSIYSNAGGQNSDLLITGDILFSMKHDTKSNVFSVSIEKAKGIAAVNAKQQTSDPYCKLYLFPDKTKASKKKTTHRRKTINPQWDETIKYKISLEELLTKTLQVSLWNHDRFGRNDFLGEVQIYMKDYASSNDLEADTPVWYTLQEMAPISIGGVGEDNGELSVGVRFDKGTLNVHIKEASSLQHQDALPNPFVKCYLLPDKSRRGKRKTAVQKKTKYPVWNEKLDFKGVGIDDLYSRVLEITVWDYNTSGHQFLGGLRLGLSHGDEYWHDCFDKEVNIWDEMMNNVGVMAQYTIPLRATMTSRKGQDSHVLPMITSITEDEEPDKTPAPDKELPDIHYNLIVDQPNTTVNTSDEIILEEDSVNEKGDLPFIPLVEEEKFETTGSILSDDIDDNNIDTHINGYTSSNIPVIDVKETEENDLVVKDIRGDNEDDNSGLLTGCGDVQIGLKYENNDKNFEVQVHKAKDLIPADLNKVKIKVNLTSATRSVGKKKTKSKKNSHSPVFDEMLSFKIGYEELVTCICNISVWHHESSGNDVQLGEVEINIEEFVNNGFSLEDPIPQWYTLHPKLEKDDTDKENGSLKKKKKSPLLVTQELPSISPAIEDEEIVLKDDTLSEKDSPSFNLAMKEEVYETEDIILSDDNIDQHTIVTHVEENLSLDNNQGNIPIVEIKETAVETAILENKEPIASVSLQSTDLPVIQAVEEAYDEDTISIISDDSEDGDARPLEQVAGEIKIGVTYDQNDSVFEVQVHEARDLLPADSSKVSADPYVKVYLTSATRTLEKKKTKTKKNSLSPVFDELLSFKIEYQELVTCVCSVNVWHHEFSRNNVQLGETEINLQELVNNGISLQNPIPQWYTLHTKKDNSDKLTPCGELILNLQYKSSEDQFHINIIQAKGLKTEEDSLYCKVSLVLPEKDTRRMKSKSVAGAVDPYWDEDFIIDNISWKELETAYLQISVRGSRGNKVFIAGTRLGLGNSTRPKHDSFGEEVRAWQSMLDRTNEAQDFCIPLRNNLACVKQDKALPPKQEEVISSLKKKHGSLSILSPPSKAKMFLNADALSLASSGSMLSIYSNAGGQNKNLVITGDILFSIKHDAKSKALSVYIEKAKGIAAVNTKQQTSDPYCKVYLFPDKTKSTKKKTSHRRKTVNPQWNETIKYNISREELLNKTLQVSIWNHDRLGRNDFLGEVQVNIKDYSSTNNLDAGSPVWYTLQEMAPISVGAADEKKGEVTIGLRLDHDILHVHIKQASGLYAVDPHMLPNSFVKCYLLPDKSRKGKRKTGVQKKSIAPVWNEKFEFKDVGIDDLYARVLEVTVWDHNTSGHQFLGGLRLGLSHGDEYWHDCFGKEVTIWESMMKHSGILAEYVIPLRSTMTSRKGQITQELPSLGGDMTMTVAPITEEPSTPAEAPLVHISLQYLGSDELDDAKKKKKKSKGMLKLLVNNASNLPMYEGDEPVTFCKGNLYPKKKSLEKKSETIKSINPNWNSEMLFDGVTLDELQNRALEINIYNRISDKKRLMIGFIRLGSGEKVDNGTGWDDSTGAEVEIWTSMLNNPTQSVTKAVPLRIAQGGLAETNE